MANPKKRVNINQSSVDNGQVHSVEHNARAGAKKVLSSGPDFQKQGSDAFISGRNVFAGGQVSPGSILYLFNNAATVAWIALSTATIGAAPTGFTDGIPLQPNSWTVLSSGENSFIRSSAATVGLYEVLDDTALRDA